MKSITEQATNSVNIIGKLISSTTRSGKTKDGKPYESVNLLVRVEENIEGRTDVSEIPVSFFASQYTNTGKLNPVYDTVQKLKGLKTIQDHGIENADVVRISKANLQENYFVTKSGQLVDTWQLRGSFCNNAPANSPYSAKFNIDVFIMNMYDEVDKEGNNTGRLVIKGAIVQYAGNLDVVEFIVENPDKVDYLQRNLEVNQTMRLGGHIRYTVEESSAPVAQSSWGETIQDESTRFIRELIVTGGADEPYEEDMGYDPAEIKKAFNIRKAKMEQLQIDAKQGTKPTAPATTSGGKFDWE